MPSAVAGCSDLGFCVSGERLLVGCRPPGHGCRMALRQGQRSTAHACQPGLQLCTPFHQAQSRTFELCLLLRPGACKLLKKQSTFRSIQKRLNHFWRQEKPSHCFELCTWHAFIHGLNIHSHRAPRCQASNASPGAWLMEQCSSSSSCPCSRNRGGWLRRLLISSSGSAQPSSSARQLRSAALACSRALSRSRASSPFTSRNRGHPTGASPTSSQVWICIMQAAAWALRESPPSGCGLAGLRPSSPASAGPVAHRHPRLRCKARCSARPWSRACR